MPAKSKKQFRFMAAVEHGGIKKKGLSKNKAAEFVDTVSYNQLPETAKPKKVNLAVRYPSMVKKGKGK